MLTFESEDGTRIFVHRWLPANEPRAVLQISHGMAEHGPRYDEMARAFVERGWAVYANDHRGHGRSVPDGEEPGHMSDDDGFARSVADLHTLNSMLAERHSGAPRVLFGHSMGSFFVQQLLADHPDDAVGFVFSGSNGRPPPIASAGRLIARAERARLGKRGKSPILKALSFDDFNKRFKPNRTEFDWISSDPAEVDKYVADPLCGFQCSVQTWIAILDALPRLTSPELVRRMPKNKPIYLFAGADDPVGGRAGVRSLADTYRSEWFTDVEIRIYEGARHETLHETNKREVIEHLLDWCDRAVHRSSA